MSRLRLPTLILLFAVVVGLHSQLLEQTQHASVPAPEPAEPASTKPEFLIAQFGQTRLRHPSPIRSLALTHDGSLLATSTRTEPLIRLWDVQTGRLFRTLQLGRSTAISFTLIGFASDGRRLLAVSNEEPYPGADPEKVWSVPVTIDLTTETVTRWNWGSDSEYEFPALAISPTGSTVAGVTTYGEVKVWELDTGRELRKLGGIETSRPNSFWGVSFSPDGTHIVATGGKRTVYTAPVAGGEPLRALPVPCGNESVGSVFWPEPNRIVAMWYCGLIALDPTSGRQLAEARFSNQTHLIYHPRVAVGKHLFVKPDRFSAVAGLDLATLELIPNREFPHNREREPLAVSANGKVLALGVGHTAQLFDANTGRSLHPELDRYPVEPPPHLETSPDGKLLVTHGGRSVNTWKLAAGKHLLAFPGDDCPKLSPDGRLLAAVRLPDKQYGIVNAETGTVVCRWPEGNGDTWQHLMPMSFNANGRVLAQDYPAGDWFEVDSTTGTVSNGPAGYRGSFTLASPDGRLLASSGSNALAIRDVDPKAGWVELEYYRHLQTARCGLSPPTCALPVRFSADHRWLLTHGVRGTYELWNVAGNEGRPNQLQGKLAGGGEWRAGDAVFSPDGRRLAAVCEDSEPKWRSGQNTSDKMASKRYIRVWETASARELMQFRPATPVAGCVFSPDGSRLIVSHSDVTIAVWDYRGLEAKSVSSTPVGSLCEMLAAPDPKIGFAAVHALTQDPRSAFALLSTQFQLADPKTVRELIAGLGDEDFATREAAEAKLTQLGWSAVGAVREAAVQSLVPEVRQRASRVSSRFAAAAPGLASEHLRATRAVEVLERIGSPDARDLLARWAKEHTATILSTEAAAAINRLDTRK